MALYFIHGFMILPFLFAALVDSRRCMEERRGVSISLWGLWTDSLEQVDSMFGEVVFAWINGPNDMMQKTLLTGFHMWAWEVVGASAGLEFKHGRHQQLGHESQCLSSFLAQAVNSEMMLRMQWMRKVFGSLVEQNEKKETAPTKTRAASLYDVVKDEHIVAMQALRQTVDITNSSFIAAVRDTIAEIKGDPARTMLYEAVVAEATDERKKKLKDRLALCDTACTARKSFAPICPPRLSLTEGAEITFNATDLSGHTTVGALGIECKGVSGTGSVPAFPVSKSLLQNKFAKYSTGGVVHGATYDEAEAAFDRLNTTSATANPAIERGEVPRPPLWMPTPSKMFQERSKLRASIRTFLSKACAPTNWHNAILLRWS